MNGPPAGSVSVVIPVWNGRRWLDGCLGSVAVQTQAPLEVIAVDNGSQDGSVAYLESAHPQVRVLELGANTGFAHAANVGIAAAQGEYVALLNTDVILDPDWIARTAAQLRSAPRVGSVACKMRQLGDERLIYDAGDVLRRDGACEQRGRFSLDDGRWDEPGEVFGACAGAALYRRTAVASVGGFDERYFAYLEDVDLALALRLEGWICRYEPVVARHAGEGSSAQAGTHRHWVARNTVLLLAKWYPARWLPLVLYRQAAWAWHAWREHRLGGYLRGLGSGLALTPVMLSERRRRAPSVRPITAVVPRLPVRGARALGHRSHHAPAGAKPGASGADDRAQ